MASVFASNIGRSKRYHRRRRRRRRRHRRHPRFRRRLRLCLGWSLKNTDWVIINHFGSTDQPLLMRAGRRGLVDSTLGSGD